MPISIGQRFIRRQNAARTSTANATAADVSYDTAVISEGGYTYNGPDVEVDTAGRYLCIFDIGQVDLASTRAVGTLVPRINGTTDQTRFRATHRYLRNSGGSQQGASIGKCILDLAANDNVRVRNPGALTPTDAVGNYATNATYGGALQLIRLPDTDWTHVERTADAAEVGTSNINATRPWLDSSGTWTTVTYNSEINDDGALYPGTGGDLTLAANTKYLIVFGATCYSTDASRHTYCLRLQVDGNNVQSLSAYQRNTASQGPPMNGMYLHETGGTTETLRMQATHEIEGGDAGTPQVADAYMQVIELPSSAEWIHADNGAADSMTTALASLTTWYDTPLSSTFRADGDSSLSLDGANNAIQNDSGGTLPILAIGWHRWDRDAGTSGTRKNPWTRWDNGGTAVGYGVAGAFSRGQQSTDDCWQAHYCSVAAMDLANNADLSFQAQDEASAANSDMGIYASTSRYFLGVQVLNLDTLDAAGGAIAGATTVTFSESATLTGSGALQANTSVAFSENVTLTGMIPKGDWGGSDLAPTVLPIRNYTFAASGGPIQGAATIAFSESATLSARGELQASATIAFGENATLTASGGLTGATSVDFSETATLSGTGALLSSESIAFGETATLSGRGSLQASSSIDFTASGTLVQTGLVGSTSIDFSESATLTGRGELQGSETIAFSESVSLSATGELQGAASVDFSESASLGGSGALTGAESIVFSESATLSGSGSLQASTSINFTATGELVQTGKGDWGNTDLAPTVLPIGRYTFTAPDVGLSGSTSIDFSENVTLTGSGALQGSTSIDLFSFAVYLTGRGRLQASASIDFTASGTLVQPDGAIQASASIDFTESATLTGRGALQGAESVDFGESATLTGRGSLEAQTTITFSESATLDAGTFIAGSTSVDFSATATLSARGLLSAETSIAFTESAVLNSPTVFVPHFHTLQFSSDSAQILFGSESRSIAFASVDSDWLTVGYDSESRSIDFDSVSRHIVMADLAESQLLLLETGSSILTEQGARLNKETP